MKPLVFNEMTFLFGPANTSFHGSPWNSGGAEIHLLYSL